MLKLIKFERTKTVAKAVLEEGNLSVGERYFLGFLITSNSEQFERYVNSSDEHRELYNKLIVSKELT